MKRIWRIWLKDGTTATHMQMNLKDDEEFEE